MSGELSLAIPEAVVEQVARRAAEIVLERIANEQRQEPASPYVTIPEAAQLLRCKRQRVDDLLSAGRLRRAARDGRRVLLLRADVEAYALRGADPERRRPFELG